MPIYLQVVLDFLEVQGLNEAVASVKASGKRVIVATPRVLKPQVRA
jgi:putative protease